MTILRTTFLSLMSVETYLLAQSHRPSWIRGKSGPRRAKLPSSDPGTAFLESSAFHAKRHPGSDDWRSPSRESGSVDGVDVAGPMTTALDEKRRFAWKGA